MTSEQFDPSEVFDLVAEAKKIIAIENIFAINYFIPLSPKQILKQLAVKDNSTKSGAAVHNWDPWTEDQAKKTDRNTRAWMFFPVQIPNSNTVAFYIANYASGLVLGVDHKKFANGEECEVKLYEWSEDPNVNERPIYFYLNPLNNEQCEIKADGEFRLTMPRSGMVGLDNGNRLKLYPPDKDPGWDITTFNLASAGYIRELPTLSQEKKNLQLSKNYGGEIEVGNQNDYLPFAKQLEEIRREMTQVVESARDRYTSNDLYVGKTILPYFLVKDPKKTAAHQIQQSPYYYVEKYMSFEMEPGSYLPPYGTDRDVELTETNEDRVTDEFSFESKTSIGFSTTEEANQGVAKESFTLSLTQEFDIGTRTATEKGHGTSVKMTYKVPANNAFAKFYKVYTLKATPMNDGNNVITSAIVKKSSTSFPVTTPVNMAA